MNASSKFMSGTECGSFNVCLIISPKNRLSILQIRKHDVNTGERLLLATQSCVTFGAVTPPEALASESKGA